MNTRIQTPEGGVDQIVRRLETAFNARDPTAMAALYTDDAMLMPPSELLVRGRQAIQHWFAQAMPRMGGIRLLATGTREAGDLAVQVGSFRMLPSPTGSGPPGPQRSGKYVLVFTRVGEQWAIAADTWNLDQPPG